MTTAPTPPVLDVRAILDATQDAPAERAMRVRNALRTLLREFEDMHNLPRSFLTKVERGEAPKATEHHNRG